MNRDLSAAFGFVLKSAREAAGLTQERLARRARLDRTYPSLLERGLRSPTLSTLMSLAPVLGIAVEALVKRTEVRLHRRRAAAKRARRARSIRRKRRRP
jgi:transcriptional regulator with XRE-family HTH domain